ncbi:MAG: hypothetical protein RLZZ136_1342 [Pseudomonadota bacterium]
MTDQQTIGAKGQGPQHFTAPTARELRAQSLNRLQLGLLGLALMLLLVGLANIVMERARQADGGNAAAISASADKKADSDPLAVIGAVPSPDASKAAQRKKADTVR